jgi:hypothetical protein
MKKIFLLTLFVYAIPVAALREGGRQFRQTSGETSPTVWRAPGDKAVSGIAILLPQMDNSLSDLDVRDSQNRPISTPSARLELENIFRENLLNLTIFAPPHSVAAIYDWLNTFSHLFNSLIYTRLISVLGLFQEAILPSIRRFVHNVHNLWITLFVPLLICSSFFTSCRFIRTPLRTNLRC